MRIRDALPLVAGALALAGCASRSLSPDDLQRTCRFGIEQKVSSPAFKANPLSNAGGGALGARAGILTLDALWMIVGAVGSTVLGLAGTKAGSICELTSHESGELEMKHL